MSDAVYHIELKDLQFFSFHGIHEEEKVTGCEFVVNLRAGYSSFLNLITDIGSTINYVSLFEIVKKEMEKPRGLLEEVAGSIADTVKKDFPAVIDLMIKIEKKNPPISSFTGSVAVTLHKQY